RLRIGRIVGRPRLLIKPQGTFRHAGPVERCGEDRAHGAVGESARRSANKPRVARTVFVRAARIIDQRSELNAARSSVEKSSGSSQAAKWPPLSGSLK